jgi:hypothetical protein
MEGADVAPSQVRPRLCGCLFCVHLAACISQKRRRLRGDVVHVQVVTQPQTDAMPQTLGAVGRGARDLHSHRDFASPGNGIVVNSSMDSCCADTPPRAPCQADV